MAITVAELRAVLTANTGQFTGAMAAASKSTNQLSTAAVGASKSTKKMDAPMAGAGKSALKMGAGLVGVTSAVAGIRAAGQTIIDFDRNMRNVNSIAQLGEKEFRALSQQVNALAGPTAQAPEVLADGLYTLVSSGFKANDALTVLKASARAATAGLTTTDVASTAVAGALNAYGLKAKDAAKVSDTLFRTVDRGVISFPQLAQGIGPVLPIAAKLGVNLKQVGAMTATLTKAGIPAAEAFTYQKGAMVALIKPTEDLQKQFKKLGVGSGKELIKKTGSLQGALDVLSDSVGGNETAMAKLFPEVRGMTAALGVTSSKSKDAAKDLDALRNSSGATEKALKEQSKSISYMWGQAKAYAGQGVNMGFDWVMNDPGVAKFATGLKDIGVGATVVADKIGLVKTATTFLEGGLNIAQGTVKAFSSALKGDLSGALAGAGQALKGSAQMLFAPIIGAATAAWNAIKNTKFGQALASAFNSAKSAASSAWGKIKGVFTSLSGPAKAAAAGVVGAVRTGLSAAIGIARSVWSRVRGAFTSLAGVAKGAVAGVVGAVRSIAGPVRSAAQAVWNAAKSALSKVITLNIKVPTPKLPSLKSLIPGNANGTSNWRGGMSLVGERGPEIVDLPKGSAVYTASQSREMMRSWEGPAFAKGKDNKKVSGVNPNTGKREMHTPAEWKVIREKKSSATKRKQIKQRKFESPFKRFDQSFAKHNLAVAMAESTAGKGDDIAALQGRIAGRSGRIAALQKQLSSKKLKGANRQRVTDELTSLIGANTSDNDQIASLREAMAELTQAAQDQTDALNAQIAQQQQIIELTKQQRDDANRAYATSQGELGAMRKFLAGMVSGQIGGDTARSFSTPAPLQLATH